MRKNLNISISKIIRNKCLIIAEAGVNHNGDINIAKKLIIEAKKSGADAIKFQTFKAKNVISLFSDKIKYQMKSKDDKETQLEMLQKLELKDKDFLYLSKFADDEGIMFSSTPKDIYSAKVLEKLSLPFIKVGSSEINNTPFLEYLSNYNSTIILSTGMCTLGEVETALNILSKRKSNKIIVLHCTSEYPCSPSDVNLLSMKTMSKTFSLPVGYSDHTNGIEVSLAAVALGAKVIEKHFTLDTSMEGPDHKSSLNPIEFKKLVKSIRNIEKSLGSYIKKPTANELENRKLIRRGLVFSKSFSAGSIISSDDINIKRPGLGIEPKDMKNIIGLKLTKDVVIDSPIYWDDFK